MFTEIFTQLTKFLSFDSKESGRMLIDFKMACKKYQKAADALLARSNIRPLTYGECWNLEILLLVV